jgi:hypothetical protein
MFRFDHISMLKWTSLMSKEAPADQGAGCWLFGCATMFRIRKATVCSNASG